MEPQAGSPSHLRAGTRARPHLGRGATAPLGRRGNGDADPLGITTALLQAGADVIVLARRDLPQDLTEVADALGRTLELVAVDLADSEAVEAAADNVLARHEVDVLVNNAGVQIRHPAADFPLDAFNQVLDVNLRAVFQLAQRFGGPMLERRDGAIINLASLLSFQGGLNVAAYAASKGGVAQLTKALANEWAQQGVRVNAVAPGYMTTEMNEALLADPVRLVDGGWMGR